MMRILFIDLRNTARSQMAEALFNQFADGWARAFSCGMMPASRMDPLTVQVMKEVGIKMRNASPKPIMSSLLTQADIIVVMGKDVNPNAFRCDYAWDFLDPSGKDLVHYRVQRDAIRIQVQELIGELQCIQLNTTRADSIHPTLLQRNLLTQQMLQS